MDDIKKKNTFSLSKEEKGDKIGNLGWKKPTYMPGDIWGILQILPHSTNFLIDSSW